jgi:hypothetical protein
MPSRGVRAGWLARGWQADTAPEHSTTATPIFALARRTRRSIWPRGCEVWSVEGIVPCGWCAGWASWPRYGCCRLKSREGVEVDGHGCHVRGDTTPPSLDDRQPGQRDLNARRCTIRPQTNPSLGPPTSRSRPPAKRPQTRSTCRCRSSNLTAPAGQDSRPVRVQGAPRDGKEARRVAHRGAQGVASKSSHLYTMHQ